MAIANDLELGGLAVLGTLGSVCAILLKSTQQNLKTLDVMRRDAGEATERLRKELQAQDDTLFQLQGLCAEYRYKIGALEAERELLNREAVRLRKLLNSRKPKKEEN